jgi:hypothetical protein
VQHAVYCHGVSVREPDCNLHAGAQSGGDEKRDASAMPMDSMESGGEAEGPVCVLLNLG